MNKKIEASTAQESPMWKTPKVQQLELFPSEG